ncbi:MAG: asparaginase [Ignavibacteriae bacterium]|nr:asparaginase [Ignavibacteriota bacterium]MCB9214650.1 asparaginase [Ignavibacteria bacterium]
MKTLPLAYSTRNDLVEGVYRGAIAVTNAAGDLLFSLGDPNYRTFLRSSIKMIQAIPVIESGAADRFEFNDAMLSICCASHTAADYHVQTVRKMLERIGLGEGALKCGGHLPEDQDMRDRLIRLEGTPTAIYNNCSGKHAGMLATCIANDWPTDGYLQETHPLQQHILELVAEYCGLDQSDIPLGIDGCSLPTYFVPLQSAARAAARFMAKAVEEGSAEQRLMRGMANHPEMVYTEGGYDTELIRVFKGRCYAKRGAMGVMIVGIDTPNGPVGIAAKMEDGENKPMSVVMTAVLHQLGLISREESSILDRFQSSPITNWNGTHVGEIKSAEISLK